MCWTCPKKSRNSTEKIEKRNKGIGGKGKLTDAMIDKLQNYNGIAIRSNSGDLQSAIYATLFHCSSSSRRNLHHYCPDGPDSWCRFKQDKINNTNYVPGPGLPDNIIELVKPIYVRLSDEKVSGWQDAKPERIPERHDLEQDSKECFCWF